MARFTKLEREALSHVISEVQAGDSYEYFNHGNTVPDDSAEHTAEHKHAVKLSKALETAARKIADDDNRADERAARRKAGEKTRAYIAEAARRDPNRNYFNA